MKREEKISDKVFIKEIIRQVQTELVESQIEREKEEILPLFEVEGLELEINFVVSNTVNKGGKLDLKVISTEFNTSYRKEQIHKLTLKLKSVNVNTGNKLNVLKKLNSNNGRLPNIGD